MDLKELDTAHFYFMEARRDLEKARYHLFKSGVDSFSWFDGKIKRMMNSLSDILEAIVNRARG